MAPIRAVADTNVLVAAAISPRGRCGYLLDLAIAGRWKLVVSPQLVDELATVLRRDKFRRWLSQEEARQYATNIRTLADVVPDPPAASNPATADPKDEFLITLIRVADVVALISGDPHLTELTDIEPPVLTPAVFLERLRRSDAGAP